ncbi:MAG: phenylalanine--tRNA ligase subunit beta [Actinobacteria bacterium]|nr:phenylalanine--tRNA ligase subunit beta [Actinomycetota bacterium]
MRVSLQWLAEYVDLVKGPEELAELLTNSGTAVDGIENLGAEYEDYIVGRVVEVSRHPSADRLSLCRVDLGSEVVDIVCGAPNVRAGIFSPVAIPGSRLPDGTVIAEAAIRGVTSRGMLLSERELGISEDAAGIMVLEEGASAGENLADALGTRDTVLDLEITPNRPDCLYMLGVAREVAALTGQKLRRPVFRLDEGGVSAAEEVQIEIVDGDLCSRYVARVIDGVNTGTSPWWMRRRLQAAGVRPISNIVDVTNYVMLELGQPLHAFDYDLVAGGHIIVRRAAEGERMTTLDGIERVLTKDDLLICDPSGPIALAGVMGGEHTEVGDATTKVLLESAHFEPANIMRTARVQDLPSEASYRFERGVDPNGCVLAADRAAYLMHTLAGGAVRPGAVDVRARMIEPVRLCIRMKRTSALIGVPLEGDDAASLLSSIDLKVLEIGGDGEETTVEVEVPTFRPDLEREIDLVEEVARLYGYDRIPATLPLSSHNIGALTREQRTRREIAGIMVGMGLHEAITMAFISPRWLDVLDPDRRFITPKQAILRNPVSEETSIMRPSLLPGLLGSACFNLNRRIMDIHLFETGRVFIPMAGEKLPQEPLRLGCILAGKWLPKQWDREAEEVGFFTCKGIMEGLMRALHIKDWSLRREGLPFLHPSQSCVARVGDVDAGCLGLLHPRIASEIDLPENTCVMELDLAAIVTAAQVLSPYEEIPRFPAIHMDMAVVVAESVDSLEVEQTIRAVGGELLREVRLFDLYRGEQLDEGEKSLAYALSFYALDRTLKDQEVRSAYEGIIKALATRFGARLR